MLSAAHAQCQRTDGVEFTMPTHYKEATTATADGCCDMCVQELGACGSWKWTNQSSKRGQCRLLAIAPTASQADALYISGLAGPAPPRRATCDATDFGCKGDGQTSNTVAIAQAIAGCDELVFRSGTFLSGTIQLRSNLILRVESGAILMGKDGEFAASRPNPWDQYQDYGHSHWYDSFIVGDNVSNVSIAACSTAASSRRALPRRWAAAAG